MALKSSLEVPGCKGINHADFSIDGKYALFTCEFGGRLAKIDMVNRQVVGYLDIDKKGMPQDIRVSPDGKVFYVADMMANGVLSDRRRRLHQDRLHPDRHRHARSLSEPRRQAAVCVQSRIEPRARRAPRQGQRLGDRLRDPQGRW